MNIKLVNTFSNIVIVSYAVFCHSQGVSKRTKPKNGNKESLSDEPMILSEYSTEDILDELRRRGIDIREGDAPEESER